MCCSQCLLKTVGSAFPFDVLSLSDSLSEIFEDDIFSFFHSFNPTSKVWSSISQAQDALLYGRRGVGVLWWECVGGAFNLAVVPH